MKRWSWAVLLVLLALPLLAAAQRDTQTLELGGGVQITVPASWEVDTNRADAVVVTGPDLTVSIALPETITGLIPGYADAADAVEALTLIVEADTSGGVDAADIEAVQIDGREVAIGVSVEQDLTGVTVPLGDSFGILLFQADAGIFTEQADLIEDIIASFELVDQTAGSTGEPCLVSVAEANSAALRVGPGENRTSIAFLPAGTEVTVTGRIDLDNGAVWYQLDKAEAAPNGTAAAELWVNAEDVDASGGCDAVADADAPPIIPIPAAPVEGELALLPDTGAWSIVLNPTTRRTCAGREPVSISSAAIYSSGPFFSDIAVIDADTFVSEGQTYRRVEGSNSFLGVFTLDGIDWRVRVDLASARRMSGEIVGSATRDGVACSDTVLFTGRR